MIRKEYDKMLNKIGVNEEAAQILSHNAEKLPKNSSSYKKLPEEISVLWNKIFGNIESIYPYLPGEDIMDFHSVGVKIGSLLKIRNTDFIATLKTSSFLTERLLENLSDYYWMLDKVAGSHKWYLQEAIDGAYIALDLLYDMTCRLNIYIIVNSRCLSDET